MKPKLLLLLFASALIVTACSSAGAQAADKVPGKPSSGPVLPAGVPAECPVTRPTKSPFVPPKPWPEQPPIKSQFWYGEAGLWTALPADGSWAQLGLGEKFWWWSEEFNVKEDETPDLRVSARRLDGKAPLFETAEATNGYHPSFDWAMLVGVELPTPGCWEFTGEYNGHTLSLVVWVSPG